MTAITRCGKCLRRGEHTWWCPETEIEVAWATLVRMGFATPERAFRTGYALGLLHTRLDPAPAAVGHALLELSPADLVRVQAFASGPFLDDTK